MYFEFNEFFSRIALYSSFGNPIDGGWSCWFTVAEVNFFVCSLKDLWVLWFFSSSHYVFVFLKRSECSILFIQRLVFTASTQRQTVSFMGLTTETTAYWVKVNGTGGKKRWILLTRLLDEGCDFNHFMAMFFSQSLHLLDKWWLKYCFLCCFAKRRSSEINHQTENYTYWEMVRRLVSESLDCCFQLPDM